MGFTTAGLSLSAGSSICAANVAMSAWLSCSRSATARTAAGSSAGNPLLQAWATPFETPPFDRIAPEHFLPAFEQAFGDHAAEIAAIVNDPAEPDFANTITALERSGKLLSRVAAVFYDLVSAHSSPELLKIDEDVSLRMARHWNPIMMNAVLFGRIAALHDKRASLKLTGEEMRLLERTYTRFHRAGAGLDAAAKARVAQINERLAQLGTSFSHHLLGDEQDWFMELGEQDTDGLPPSFLAAAKAAARRALTKLRGTDVTTALVEAAKAGEPALRPVFIDILADRRASAALPELVAAAGDADAKAVLF